MSETGLAVCPFYKKEVDEKLYCELATLRLPDAESKAQIRAYCCSMEKHKECTLYQVLSAHWDRKCGEGHGKL